MSDFEAAEGRISKILVIDDDENIRTSLYDILNMENYRVVTESDGHRAIDVIREQKPDVILLDVNMPGMSGIEITKIIKDDPQLRLIPVIIVTGNNDQKTKLDALKSGADEFLNKPPHVAELLVRVRALLKVKAFNDHLQNYQSMLESQVKIRTRQLEDAFEEIRFASIDTIYRLSRAAEYKDDDTATHLHRMSRYCIALGQKIGLDDDTLALMQYGAPMHDIGKIGIPDSVLLKPGKLTSEEWEIMKTHTLIGARILENSKSRYLQMAKLIALTHHERWDGSGYPNGLEGDDIPMAGRVAAVADVFDALTTQRPYKKAFPTDQSFGIIEEESGSHFDPDLVKAFLEIKKDILEIYSDREDE